MEEMIDLISQEFIQRHDPIERAKRRAKRIAKKKEGEQKPKIRDYGDQMLANSHGPGHANFPSLDAKGEMLANWRRDEVLWRDQKQCTYIHANGKRCKETRWLQVHHIIPKSQGGGDYIDNLITLCPNHHRLIHFQSGWQEDQRTRKLIFDEKKRQQNLSSLI